ncbi:MAG: Crp/Fnr family transcriptional regulator [Candidatus Helarchaeota archaeon]|nr:Crp/Fnr family transcriptional regulator [Candidatus Helarchaeota archaeon]
MSLSLLKKVPLFNGLSEKELKSILRLTSSKRYYKNNMILVEADEVGDIFYIIDKGKVKVSRVSEDGKEVILSVLGSGDFFGEMSLLDGLSRSANVTSLDKAEVLTLSGKDFLDLLHKYPRISYNLIKVLCARIRRLDAQIKKFSLMNTIGKVASTILSLAESGKKKGTRSAEIERLPSLKDIASMAGTSKSSVSRVLNNLQKIGHIKKEGKKVIIVNYDEFKKMYC